ncbi:MAG: DsbC family protein [Gemmatimonadota bacterium]
MSRVLVALMMMVATAFAFAQPAKPVDKAAAAKPASVEDTIRMRVEQRFGAKPTAVKLMPFGLYEVTIGTDVAYVDKEASYLFVGRVIDTKTKEDLTQARRDELQIIDYKSLPFDQAFKVVRGDGSRQFAVFADPNCPYCKKFEKDLVDMKNVTIYTFLYPILSRDPSSPADSYERARNIWCAKDRKTVWEALMIEGKAPPVAPPDCKHPLQQNLALGQKLEVSGTPTIFFVDGRRLPGAVPADRIEAGLARAAAKK